MTVLNNSTTAEVTIDTVTPTLKLGELQLSADRRGKELTDAERIRRVVLPSGHWGELAGTLAGTASQGLTDVLREALKAIGSARLRDTLAENPLARTVALSDYSVPALLTWNAETATSRGSITFTREQVEEWFPTSSIYSAMTTKGAQWAEFVGKRLATLAAKNHGLKKPEDADKLAVLLEQDATSAIGAELIQRLQHISKSLQQRTADALSLDDL